jgi:hypothetical protein
MRSFLATSRCSPSVLVVLWLVSLTLTACTALTPSSQSPQQKTSELLPTITRTPFQPLPPTLAATLMSETPAVQVTSTPTAILTPTAIPPTGEVVPLWVAPYLPHTTR